MGSNLNYQGWSKFALLRLTKLLIIKTTKSMKEKRIAKEIAKFEKLMQREARRLAKELEGYFDILQYGI